MPRNEPIAIPELKLTVGPLACMFDRLVVVICRYPVGSDDLSDSVEPIEAICWQSEPLVLDVQGFATMTVHLGYKGLVVPCGVNPVCFARSARVTQVNSECPLACF